METPSIPNVQIVDLAGTIITDVACRRCGYNLRGLRQDGRCPECGTPIGLSVQGDLLRFADPDWVEKMARGIRLMLWGILIAFVVGIIGGIITATGKFPTLSKELIQIVGGLVGVYGAWLLTAPDPSRVGEDRYLTARRVVRFGLIVGLFGGVAAGLIKQVPQIDIFLRSLTVGGAIILGLIGVAGEFAKYLYIQKIAERIPNPTLAGRARFLRWALSIGLAAMVIVGAALAAGFWKAGVFTPTGAAAPNPSLNSAVGTTGSAPAAVAISRPPGGLLAATIGVGCISAVGALVFGIMILVLYFQLDGELRRQAELARLTWAAHATPVPTPPALPTR